MPTKVNIPSPFVRQLHKLAKKYPTVLKEFEGLSDQLKTEQTGKTAVLIISRYYKIESENK